MKFVIASDIHGCAPAMNKLAGRIEEEAPNRVLLLGDLLYHGPRNDLPEGYNPKEVLAILNGMASRIMAVRGNCDAEVDQMVLDFPCMADYSIISADNHLLYLTHGHLAGKSIEEPPTLAAGSAFLSGHTHIKRLEMIDDVLYVNPGSISIPKDGVASYAVYKDGIFILKSMAGEVLQAAGWKPRFRVMH